MDYMQFREAVPAEILKFLPEGQGYSVQVIPCKKNNGAETDGMAIKDGERISPVLNLENYYQDYLACGSLEQVLKTMAEDYQACRHQDLFTAMDFSYESLKEHIFITVCNAEKNRDRLKEIPHELHEDLALTYRVNIDMGEQGSASLQISNHHLGMWGIDEETLKAGAWESMQKELPVLVSTMEDELSQSGFQVLLDENEEMCLFMPSELANPFHILSNQEHYYGAAYMFDEKVMEELSELLEGDLIIIPSSIHEVLVMKETEDLVLEDLKGIVSEVNREQVSAEEFLSDEVYRYDAVSRTLTIAEDCSGPQMGMAML